MQSWFFRYFIDRWLHFLTVESGGTQGILDLFKLWRLFSLGMLSMHHVPSFLPSSNRKYEELQTAEKVQRILYGICTCR
jgi:hypothetical protein